MIRQLKMGLILAGVVMLGSIGHADTESRHHGATSVATGEGTWHKGEIHTELYFGVAVPDELLVVPTRGCDNPVHLHLKWDEERNYVKVHLKGKNVLEPFPTVRRTEGVDYIPNVHWPEIKDVIRGRYQLWIIMPGPETPYYYDAQTLELLGGVHDFDTPPEGAITLNLPGFNAVPTDFFQPDRRGNLDFTHVFEYDRMLRGDLPSRTHQVGTFIPHTLCKAHPFRYDLTSTRPHVSPSLTADHALPFSDYLRSGLLFDLTIEPPEYFTDPPLSTNIATYSQALQIAGGVPNGWTADLEAAFSNLAPAIRPYENAGSCTPFFKPKRDRDFDVCTQ